MIIVERPTITLQAAVYLDEAEARALYELSRFDAKAIHSVLEQGLSSDFGEKGKHGKGLLSLLRGADQIGDSIRRVDEARKIFTKEKP